MKLSQEAKQYAEDNFINIDKDLGEFVKDALDRPDDAAFWDDELYVTHTLAFHTPDWSLTNDDIIGQANYRTALEILEPLGAESATVGHWTYSSFQCIKVPILNESDEITAAAVQLWELVMQLQDYPVLKDEEWSELEWEINEAAMEDALKWEQEERDMDFSEVQKQKIRELYWNDYSGHFEAGYIGGEEFQEIIERVLSGDYQLHQEVALW